MNAKRDDDRKGDGEQPLSRGQQQQQQPQQPQSGSGQQYGEGSYSGTRQYNEGLKKHMNQHDVEREALDAAPRSEEEARQMEGQGLGRSAVVTAARQAAQTAEDARAIAVKRAHDSELAEARRLGGATFMLSLAHLRAQSFFETPAGRALEEATYFAGMRKAGMPEG